MKITQLRNATIVLEFTVQSAPVALLVDPMLSRQGGLPTLRYLGGTRRRNPIVELPEGADAVLGRVTHALITHCQRGHFDHLDRSGKQFLRGRGTPVLCMPRDADYLATRGLVALPLVGTGRQPFLGSGHITPIACLHGRGWVGRLMEHGHGYLIEMPGEPSVYIAGDTVLTPEVRDCLTRLRPELAVLPAGGARFDLGGEILMDGKDMIEACTLAPGMVVANHLEALDHCPTTRSGLAALAADAGVQERLWIPEDGESRVF